jgi:hypothetical protein
MTTRLQPRLASMRSIGSPIKTNEFDACDAESTVQPALAEARAHLLDMSTGFRKARIARGALSNRLHFLSRIQPRRSDQVVCART